MRKVAYRIVMENGEPISQWTDIQFMEQANLHPSRVIEYAYAAPVVTDDTRLMDFLADLSQDIANVQLPRHIVERNVHSLRDAIADTMAEWKASQSDQRSN